jgi:hypothetical protein
VVSLLIQQRAMRRFRQTPPNFMACGVSVEDEPSTSSSYMYAASRRTAVTYSGTSSTCVETGKGEGERVAASRTADERQRLIRFVVVGHEPSIKHERAKLSCGSASRRVDLQVIGHDNPPNNRWADRTVACLRAVSSQGQ